MWLNKVDISENIYIHCLENNNSKLKKYITDSYFAYYYCKNIKDDSKVAKHITEFYYQYLYHKHVSGNINQRDEALKKYKRIKRIKIVKGG